MDIKKLLVALCELGLVYDCNEVWPKKLDEKTLKKICKEIEKGRG